MSVAHSQEAHFRDYLKRVEDWSCVDKMLVGRIAEVYGKAKRTDEG